MRKRISGIRALFCVFLMLMLAHEISGCAGINPSLKVQAESSTSTMAPLELSTKPSVTNSSGEITSEPATNRSKIVSVKELQAVPVLYYHSVMLEAGNDVRVPPDQFEAQMDYLKETGYECITLDQLYQAKYLGGTLPPKPFVITFDDGYLDNYTTAFPILKKHGFVAVIFMVTSYIDGEGFMSWPQLKELAANGWEIEGHTANHPYLTKQDIKTVFNELKRSKEQLEKQLKHSVDYFAYPYGDANSEVAQAVKSTGYLLAFTTERGWADLHEDVWHLHRVYCFANMGMSEFSRRLQNPDY